MKKVFSLALIAVMVLCTAVTAFGQEQDNSVAFTEKIPLKELAYRRDLPANFAVVNPDGTCIYVYVNKKMRKDVDGLLIKKMISENNLEDGCALNIYHVGYAENKLVEKSAADSKYITTFSSGAEQTAEERFVTSVAKGSSGPLNEDWSYAVSGRLKPGASVYDFAAVVAKLGGKLTCTYPIGKVFDGPRETSVYNSREYRVWFLSKTVTVTQTNRLFPMMKTTFSYEKASRYVEYSIDRNVG